jgi:hypothetical protein
VNRLGLANFEAIAGLAKYSIADLLRPDIQKNEPDISCNYYCKLIHFISSTAFSFYFPQGTVRIDDGGCLARCKLCRTFNFPFIGRNELTAIGEQDTFVAFAWHQVFLVSVEQVLIFVLSL